MGHETIFGFSPDYHLELRNCGGGIKAYARSYSAEDIGVRFNLLCLSELESGLAAKAALTIDFSALD